MTAPVGRRLIEEFHGDGWLMRAGEWLGQVTYEITVWHVERSEEPAQDGTGIDAQLSHQTVKDDPGKRHRAVDTPPCRRSLDCRIAESGRFSTRPNRTTHTLLMSRC